MAFTIKVNSMSATHRYSGRRATIAMRTRFKR